VIFAFRRPCADHRAALLDFVDRRERSAATPAALAHLARCARCESELSQVALTIAALRRLQSEVLEAAPADDGWVRLRRRVARPVDPWPWRASLGGLATSAMLVAVLVLPITIGQPATLDNGLGLPDNPAARAVESSYLASIRAGTLPPVQPVSRGGGSVPRTYPPEIAQVRKEVTSAPQSVRLPEPI
jgi:hypothetical protein